MRSYVVSALAFGAAAAAIHSPAAVRKVDHIVIGTADPRALFSLLADTLRLPVAWPLASFGSFQSGGVAVGNLNIEVGRARARGVDSAQAARFNAVVFEPAPLPEALAELDVRGVAHEKPLDYGMEPGTPPDSPAWTTVKLTTLSDRGLDVVLCEYHRPDVRALGRALADSLRARGGGPLGALMVRTVIIGTGGDSSVHSAWRSLLSPMERRMTWSLDPGPALELDAGAPRGHVRIVIQVRSLASAADFLRSRAMLGESSPHELRIARDRIGGLDIRLVDRSDASF